MTAGLSTEQRRLLLGANCRRVFRLEGVEDFLEAELSDFDRAVLV